jgi:DNA-binding MarR family transcriptional regulator
MSPADDESASAESKSVIAHEVWQLMSDLVLDNQRRREVSEAVGMSFGRARAVRRVARQPMSMSQLAAALGMERPNATTLVNDLEDKGLVIRQADPNDRRTRLVVATRKGKKLAKQANDILQTPPAGLESLDREDLEEIRRVLAEVKPPAD